MKSTEAQIRTFRRRSVLLAGLAFALRYLAVWFLVWGVGVLALRTGFDPPRSLPLWGLAGALPAVALAAAAAWRRRPAAGAVRAFFDRHNRSGGLLMAAAEVDVGGWKERLHGVEAPRLRWRSGSSWAALAGAAVFVLLSFLVPVSSGEVADRPLEIDHEIGELAERIEILEDEHFLDDGLADRLEADLLAARDSAVGDEPARTWEALDHLREMTGQTAAAAAEAALADAEKLAAAAAVAEALESREASDPDQLAEAMADLAALTGRIAEEGRLLDPELAAALTAAVRSGSPRDLGELREKLARGQDDLEAALRRMQEAGMLDLEALLEARRAGELDDEELSRFLEENGLPAAGAMCRNTSGSPGISRGRGDAPMIWKDPASSEGTGFREEVLSPSQRARLDRSGLLGLSAAAPRDGDPAAPVRGSALEGAAAGGGGAHTQTVLPRHRGAVRRYFDRRRPAATAEPAAGSETPDQDP